VEKRMNAAGKTLRDAGGQAAPALVQAEGSLRELAAHLRLLDQPPDEKALAKLEERAEEAAASLAGSAKSAKAGKGKSPASEASSKPGESSKGEKPGSEAGSTPGETPAEIAAKVAALAEEARTLDDTLRHWSGGEGNGAQHPSRAALGRLAEAQKTGQLAKDLAALAENLAKAGDATKAGDASKAGDTGKAGDAPKPGDAKQQGKGTTAGDQLGIAEQAAKLAEQHQQIAAGLRQEREAQRQTRAQQLAEMRARVQEAAGDNFTGQPEKRGAPLEPSQPARAALGRNLPGEKVSQLIDDLRASGDADLGQWAEAIETNRKRPVLAWRALRLADMRLATILTDLKRVAPVAVRESTVPDAYRRLVESYFLSLSDDFGSEESAQAATK
jgi:hypothetical protein